VVRVSLGGSLGIGGYYCVYRGRKEEAIACLKAALDSMLAMAQHLGDGEPEISPDQGKKYA
jgi:hypothetical protein